MRPYHDGGPRGARPGTARGALVSYGPMDEPLTGENDKPVKYVWRFPDAKTIVFELHDLAIGEPNTKVVEVTYRRP